MRLSSSSLSTAGAVRRSSRSLLLGLPLWLLALVACGPSNETVDEVPPPPAPKNVVFVLLDTLRADHLSFLGYARPTSPFLDQLAAEGLVFERMVSAAPATFPSVNSLFTSLHPSFFYRTASKDFGIPESRTTMAEIFRDRGFRTAAVSSSPVVRSSPSFFNPDGGFGQGFETFDESCGFAKRHVPPFTAPCVTDRALELLEGFAEAPFLLYVHYLDPHDPYNPPPEAKIFSSPYAGENEFLESGSTFPIRQLLRGQRDDFEIGEGDIEYLRDLYDEEIRAVDDQIRRLVGAVEARGSLEETLFVFVSDHGESFLEHEAVWQHGTSVYQSELHTVLMFYQAGRWPSGDRRSHLACTVDVLPTLLELMDFPPTEEAVGASLLDDSPTRRSSACYSLGRGNWKSQKANLLSLRVGSEKLIYKRQEEVYELYDLATDPMEQQNLATLPEYRERLRALATLLAVWEQDEGGEGPEGTVELDPEAERALRALGYID